MAESKDKKAYYNIDTFLATIKNKGTADTNRFEVIITPPKCLVSNPDYEQTFVASLYADQVSFPPLSLFVKQCRIYGPAQQRPITSDYGGDGLSISFLLDRDMSIKQMFDFWMQSIVDKDTHTVAYQADYACEIEIRQLDRKDNITYSVKLKDAFPKLMNQMDMNNSHSGQHHHLLVTFAYHKWTVSSQINYS